MNKPIIIEAAPVGWVVKVGERVRGWRLSFHAASRLAHYHHKRQQAERSSAI